MGRRLPPLPNVQELIKLYGLTAKSQLSQNFILDSNVTARIARTAFPTVAKNLKFGLEIGPGPGCLTRSLLVDSNCPPLTVSVEKDRRFLPALKILQDTAGKSRFVSMHGDALILDEGRLVNDVHAARGTPEVGGWKSLGLSEPYNAEDYKADEEVPVDFSKRRMLRASNTALVGNLPYAIGTPLLMKWLRDIFPRKGIHTQSPAIMTFLFQKEVAERMIALPGTPAYSRLTVMVQNHCYVSKVFDLPAKVFVPAPKVDSSVVQLVPRAIPLVHDVPPLRLEALTTGLFNTRRKQLRSSLSTMCTSKRAADEILEKAELPGDIRATDLGPLDIGRIYNAIHSLPQAHLQPAARALLFSDTKQQKPSAVLSPTQKPSSPHRLSEKNKAEQAAFMAKEY